VDKLDLDDLPPLPQTAQRLLSMDEEAVGTREVAEWVELDPALAAHVVRLANSPWLGVRERIGSIHDAVQRLGCARVTELALGLAAGAVFKIPGQGPLGAHDFWRHAVFTAALMHRLAKLLPDFGATQPGMAYLCGLLHNIGLLALAHLDTPAYHALNRAVQEEPDTPLVKLERRLLAHDHTRLGSRLLRHWRMPPPVVFTAHEHHNPHYRGDQHSYVNLCTVASAVVKAELGLGDGDPGCHTPALAALGLDEGQLAQEWEALCEYKHDLMDTARHIAHVA